MRELSLHILDIVQNSTRARASEVQIMIEICTERDELSITIEDNGEGMSKQMTQDVLDPFVTTRTTRRVGLGLPLFKDAAERAEGGFILKSEEGKGTVVTASFKLSHIDRTPMGDLISTMITLIQGNPDVDFLFTYRCDNGEYGLSTRYIREELAGVPLNHPMVLEAIQNDLIEGLEGKLID